MVSSDRKKKLSKKSAEFRPIGQFEFQKTGRKMAEIEGRGFLLIRGLEVPYLREKQSKYLVLIPLLPICHWGPHLCKILEKCFPKNAKNVILAYFLKEFSKEMAILAIFKAKTFTKTFPNQKNLWVIVKMGVVYFIYSPSVKIRDTTQKIVSQKRSQVCFNSEKALPPRVFLIYNDQRRYCNSN